MSPTAVVLAVLTAAGFPLLLWAIGRTVTAMGERVPYSRGPKQYLAGRVDEVRITTLLDGGDELLVSLTTPATDESPAAAGLLDKVFRVTASECSLDRVRRWREKGTLPRLPQPRRRPHARRPPAGRQYRLRASHQRHLAEPQAANLPGAAAT